MTIVRYACALLCRGVLRHPRSLARAAAAARSDRLPAGFAIEVLARAPGARQMTFGANGTLFVGSVGGRVYAITLDANGQRPATVRTIASDLREPAGVAFRDGALYVSAVSRILRLDDIERRLDNPPQPVVVSDRFPTDGQHGRKFIAFGPDGKLYVPVGAPCNICEPDPDRYANIMRMNADGSDLEVVARGIRNTVGFDWDPRTRELWFTSNGRDKLGDDVPPDTLNHVTRAGEHFGYPYCHAGTIADPEFGGKRPCSAIRGAGAAARAARRSARHALLYGHAVPRSATAARSSSPSTARGTAARKIGYRVTVVRLDATGKAGFVRAVRRRLAAGPAGMGPAGRCARGAGRLAAGLRRLRRCHLPHPLPPALIAVQDRAAPAPSAGMRRRP